MHLCRVEMHNNAALALVGAVNKVLDPGPLPALLDHEQPVAELRCGLWAKARRSEVRLVLEEFWPDREDVLALQPEPALQDVAQHGDVCRPFDHDTHLHGLEP